MTALLLTVYAAGLVVIAGPRLARAGWVLRAPGLAIFLWQMVCATVLISAALVGATSMLHWDDTHSVMCQAWQLCLDALQGAHGRPAQAVAMLGATLLTLIGARLLIGGWRVTVAERRQRRLLRTMLRMTGTRLPVIDATMVPDDRPAAYLVPGAADVVVTSGAVDALSKEELQAVMAHERAHASGRHYLLLRTVRLLHRAFPRVQLFSMALTQVHRLVELRADEVAARSNPPLTLARALVAMAEAGTRPAGEQVVLGADGGDTVERLDRLLQPPMPLPSPLVRGVVALGALLPVLPLLIAAADRSSLFG
ncbi:M56 family metallopeptidase [Dactylosporangium sp. NPDC000521]|uniref:M56 family metallopeptidase n=1 Tax=Dactylosporangium sp. NPDC000521 TaxID=3363975 RepID=UPI00368A9213